MINSINYISTIEEIADYYLSKKAMTNKKLQKICYYAYSWILTLLNDPEDTQLKILLFEDKFEGWVHGPVCRKLYEKYKIYGWNSIEKKRGLQFEFSDAIVDVLEQVWDVYGENTGDELEDISHQEEPWKNSRIGLSSFEPGTVEISDDVIFKYYSRRFEE